MGGLPRANVENKYSSKASDFDFILLWILALLIIFVMLSNSWSLIAGFRDYDFSILIYVLITVLLVYIKINGSLFAALSSGFAICPSGVMVLSEVVVIVFVHAS